MQVQDKILKIKLIKEALDRRECEEFEIALRHKSKLHVYKELKHGVGFEEYMYIKVPPSRLFFKVLFRYQWLVRAGPLRARKIFLRVFCRWVYCTI